MLKWVLQVQCQKKNKGLGQTILDTLSELFGFHHHQEIQRGTIDLAHGKHELEIHLQKTPAAVWTSFKGAAVVPVCIGGMDMIGVQIVHNGFVIYANIQSASRSINWFANL